MTVNSPITKVAIIGASSAGLLAAVALKHYFPQLEILLLYTHRYPGIGVGESTTAWLPQFLHEYLQISPGEFYREVLPVWKLGIRFEWGDRQNSHFNYTFDRQFTTDSPLLSKTSGFYCMYDLQQASRFSILMDRIHAPLWFDKNQQIKLVTEGFGYHLDVNKFSNFLLAKAQALGVKLKELEVFSAEKDELGNIKYLHCQNDIKVAADLFIDCSGFKSQLLGKELQENFISYGDHLFCDSAIVGNWQRKSSIFPFTTATTMNAGWRWRIDLRDRVSFGYVYSSHFYTEEEAIEEYLSANNKATDNLRKISFISGRYQRFWLNNVIAVGNASGFVEPLESTGQHMIAETIWRIVLALQDSNLRLNPKLIAATNQYIGDLWDEICDFLSLHFKFNRKLDTPFWKHCREHTPLGELQEIVELYQESGVCRAIAHLVPQSSIFEVDGYLTMLCGQGLPIKYQPSISDREKAEWYRYRQYLQQELEHSLSPQKAFPIVENYLR